MLNVFKPHTKLNDAARFASTLDRDFGKRPFNNQEDYKKAHVDWLRIRRILLKIK